VEARLNATNQALHPSAGGIIEYWSDAIEGEIRDDQGISLHNPDTDVFMKYTLAGAYDSNIALLLTVGDTRLDCYRHMAEVIRQTTHARQGPGDQPRIPLRPGELVHRSEHQCPSRPRALSCPT
jgi:acetyl/propionyl-CoA carboxylase alpha subunit